MPKNMHSGIERFCGFYPTYRAALDASGNDELVEALTKLRAEVQRLLLTATADRRREDCPVMAVAKASAKAGNVLAAIARTQEQSDG
jgi:hypothetical protein